MNRIDTLAELFGSSKKVAEALGVSPAVVSRWKSSVGHRPGDDRIPVQYNHALRVAGRMIGKGEEVAALLDPDVCPCCKRQLEPGQQLDQKMINRLVEDARRISR